MSTKTKTLMNLIRLVAAGVLLLAGLAGCASAESDVLTLNMSEPLNGITNAKVEIDPGDGNLTVDTTISSEQELASGTLQYLENQGQPVNTVETDSELPVFIVKASKGEQPWVRLPWAECNGATDWKIHLNPKVTSELFAHTSGGNVELILTDMALTRLLADTGGGNMDVILPDKVENLNATIKTGAGDVSVAIGSSLTGSSTVSASSGAGNVTVRVPAGVAARIHATSGLGETAIDARFSKVDDTTYQSPDYDSTANRIEITISSGAGNVTIETNS